MDSDGALPACSGLAIAAEYVAHVTAARGRMYGCAWWGGASIAKLLFLLS